MTTRSKTATNLVGRFAVRAPKTDRMAHDYWPRNLDDEAEIVEVYRETRKGERGTQLYLSLVDQQGRTGEVRFDKVTVRLASPLFALAAASAVGAEGSELSQLRDEHEKLVAFAKQHGLRPNWHEPDEQDITALVDGEKFDNAGGAREFKVYFHTIGKKGQRTIKPLLTMNLASLCALAARP